MMINMVASVDGATVVDGRSDQLGGPGDRQVFRALRGVADMILVGAGTVRAEGYQPPRTPDDRMAVVRATAGRSARPRLVVVSGRLDLDPMAPLFAERLPVDQPPLVATVRSASADRRAALEPVADLIALGETRVDLTGLLATLGDLGARTVLCEGGPDLNHQLLAAGLVDELCLTISPMLVGAPEPQARGSWTVRRSPCPPASGWTRYRPTRVSCSAGTSLPDRYLIARMGPSRGEPA